METTIVDHMDAANLRKIAQSHSNEYIRASCAKIEDVDVVLDSNRLDEACLRINPEGFDYLIASHVIEHVPNLIGFFNEASRLLKSDGLISLAVPDMRRCSDVVKPVSDLGEMLAAHLEDRRIHSLATMFRALFYACNNAGQSAWVEGASVQLELRQDFMTAWQTFERYARNCARREQMYVDQHAWFFVPASFRLTVLELSALGLIDLHVDFLALVEGSEFIVQLRRGKLDLTSSEIAEARLELLYERHRELADIPFSKNRIETQS